jgi:hypothetical protein
MNSGRDDCLRRAVGAARDRSRSNHLYSAQGESSVVSRARIEASCSSWPPLPIQARQRQPMAGDPVAVMASRVSVKGVMSSLIKLSFV